MQIRYCTVRPLKDSVYKLNQILSFYSRSAAVEKCLYITLDIIERGGFVFGLGNHRFDMF